MGWRRIKLSDQRQRDSDTDGVRSNKIPLCRRAQILCNTFVRTNKSVNIPDKQLSAATPLLRCVRSTDLRASRAECMKQRSGTQTSGIRKFVPILIKLLIVNFFTLENVNAPSFESNARKQLGQNRRKVCGARRSRRILYPPWANSGDSRRAGVGPLGFCCTLQHIASADL